MRISLIDISEQDLLDLSEKLFYTLFMNQTMYRLV